ncbi:ABC transporter substrate-binding protein [Allofranklinella schreckenbergeri]|uniref:ABC transporter substrate-binding protein n=1 Tax=Allofranklinella schreckenbergeri TaxID=1076744 RepID=A0A3M6QCP0_9BURK|nr:ABC transporter substrate-binding protein [Allofranklinella schreckenbergeri]RMX00391.1 ABC transporter substrate-binding protein [Allofranklinella schreckenbergeri]RMX00686.1 ABC transporter substrate-binding protein [Allofranklinella schreckenbergeri]
MHASSTRRHLLNATAAALLGFGLLAGAQAQVKSVAVTAIVEHPSLDAIRDGVKAVLEENGFKGDKLKWQYQSAQGNTATAAQIARKFIGEKPDVIVPIATPSAQAVVSATKEIAVVYSGVTDPVAAQLVKSMDASGTNVTGVSDAVALADQIELIKKIVPNAKRVGMVYNPGEANSVSVAQELKRLLPQYGLELVESNAPRTVDITAATRNLVGKVDVIYTNSDNNVFSALEALIKVANEAKIPVISSVTDAVKRGATAALGIDYYDLGRQSGQMVVRILNGEKPGAIPSETGKKLELFINPGAAKNQGATLPEDLVKSAKEVVQ